MSTMIKTNVSKLLEAFLPQKAASAGCSPWLYQGCCGGNRTKRVQYCDNGHVITKTTRCDNGCIY